MTPLSSNSELARELRHHYLFSALDDTQHATILAHAFSRRFGAGDVLFRRGDAAEYIFMMRSGSLKLYRLSQDGHEKVMRIIRPPQTFAESMMFMDTPQYPMHCEGVEAGEVIAFEISAFLALLQESFATCRAVMAQMTQRIQAHWDEIETLSLQNSHYRVVHYLLSLVPPGTEGEVRITLPVRKVLIASRIAVTPETLSRALRALSDNGLIEIEDDVITILDTGALRKRIH